MLAALAVVCEKEIGSIINLYMTPVSRSEFLLGKQLPYVALALINFLLMVLVAIFLFGVPVKGSFPTLLLAASIYCVTATGMGLPASSLSINLVVQGFSMCLSPDRWRCSSRGRRCYSSRPPQWASFWRHWPATCRSSAG